jgi:hypothetical protein
MIQRDGPVGRGQDRGAVDRALAASLGGADGAFDANINVQPSKAAGGRFTKDHFDVDLETDTVTCPNHVTVAIAWTKRSGGSARFADACASWPLAGQCTDSPQGAPQPRRLRGPTRQGPRPPTRSRPGGRLPRHPPESRTQTRPSHALPTRRPASPSAWPDQGRRRLQPPRGRHQPGPTGCLGTALQPSRNMGDHDLTHTPPRTPSSHTTLRRTHRAPTSTAFHGRHHIGAHPELDDLNTSRADHNSPSIHTSHLDLDGRIRRFTGGCRDKFLGPGRRIDS